MIFPALMRSECAVLACSGVIVAETNLKLLAQTSSWILLPISPGRSSQCAMGSNPSNQLHSSKQPDIRSWHLVSRHSTQLYGRNSYFPKAKYGAPIGRPSDKPLAPPASAQPRRCFAYWPEGTL